MQGGSANIDIRDIHDGINAKEGIHVTAQINLKPVKDKKGNVVIGDTQIIQVYGPGNEVDYTNAPGVSLTLSNICENLIGLPMPKNNYMDDNTIEAWEDDGPEEYGYADGGYVEDKLMKFLGFDEGGEVTGGIGDMTKKKVVSKPTTDDAAQANTNTQDTTVQGNSAPADAKMQEDDGTLSTSGGGGVGGGGFNPLVVLPLLVGASDRRLKNIKAYFKGGAVGNTEAEENKLVKRAEELQGSPDMRNLLISEAEADGYEREAEVIVANVIKRMANHNTGKQGNALKKGHNANDRLKHIKAAVAGARAFG